MSVILLVGLGLIAQGCSSKKIRPLRDILKKESGPIQYQMGPDSTGQIFVDKTEEYGLSGVEGVHLYAVDVNNDGATDLVVLDDFFSAPKFYLFNKKLKKFELSDNPFPEVVRGHYMLFADFDRDGIYDVIVGTRYQKTALTQHSARVYKGKIEQGKLAYELQSTLSKEVMSTSSIVPLDFDLDGELDLFLANWFDQKKEAPKLVPDSLLKGKKFEFTDSSSKLNEEYEYDSDLEIYSNATPTFGATICDVNRDGFPDILTNNSNGYFNKLWLNHQGVELRDIGELSGYAADGDGLKGAKGGGNSFFSLCGDYNNDGIVDVVVGNLSRSSDPDSRDKSAILTGKTKKSPPEFIRSEFFHSELKNAWSEGNRRGLWLDYNLDGLSDLLIANSGFPPDSRLILFEQQSDHAYEDKAKELGINILNPSGMVSIDLNQDGVMDFITGQTKVRAGDANTRLYVFENQTPRNGNGSMRFYLRGKKSNYHGISSSVTFKTNENEYFSEANYVYGSLPSQNEEGLYFAFGKERPEELIVRWSYGTKNKSGTIVPLIKKYNLRHLSGKGKHLEFNVCESGRIVEKSKACR